MSNDYALFLIHVPNDFDEETLTKVTNKTEQTNTSSEASLDTAIGGTKQRPSVASLSINALVVGGDKSKDVPSSTSLCVALKNYLASRSESEPVWLISDDRKTYQISFYIEFGVSSDQTLQDLLQIGVGKRANTKIFVLPTAIVLEGENDDASENTEESSILNEANNDNDLVIDKFYNDIEDSNQDESGKGNKFKRRFSESNFKKSVRARLMVHQVVASIRASTELSFDFIVLLSLASMIAGFGLLENSTVSIVASMLVSPLMNPIMGIVFGLSIREHTLWRRGIRNELIGLLLCVVWGFLIGLLTTHSETKWGSTPSFPTPEMRGRGDVKRLWVGVLIALPSGAGVALSVLGGNTGSLVGVAISASLLPPAVNSGLLFAYSILVAGFSSIGAAQSSSNVTLTASSTLNCPPFVNNTYVPLYYCNLSHEAAVLAASSLLLTIVNILCIIVMALIILRIKEVAPLHQQSKEVANFFHHDIKVARDYNKTMHAGDLDQRTFTIADTQRTQMAQTIVDQWKRFALSNSQQNQTNTDLEVPKSINDEPPTLTSHAKNLLNVDTKTREKLIRLIAFAKEFDLDLLNEQDYDMISFGSRGKVRLLVNELIDMSEEIDNAFVDLSRLQPGTTKSSTDREYQAFYRELIEALPPKWLQMLSDERERRQSAFLPSMRGRSISLISAQLPHDSATIHAGNDNERRQVSFHPHVKHAKSFNVKPAAAVAIRNARELKKDGDRGTPVKGTRFRIAQLPVQNQAFSDLTKL